MRPRVHRSLTLGTQAGDTCYPNNAQSTYFGAGTGIRTLFVDPVPWLVGSWWHFGRKNLGDTLPPQYLSYPKVPQNDDLSISMAPSSGECVEICDGFANLPFPTPPQSYDNSLKPESPRSECVPRIFTLLHYQGDTGSTEEMTSICFTVFLLCSFAISCSLS